MNQIKERMLRIKAASKYGFPEPCDCSDGLKCDRSFPTMDQEAWAAGVLEAFNSIENYEVSQAEIDHFCESYRKEHNRE